jgi:hypothetical protein
MDDFITFDFEFAALSPDSMDSEPTLYQQTEQRDSSESAPVDQDHYNSNTIGAFCVIS